jgi:hypothetical protein
MEKEYNLQTLIVEYINRLAAALLDKIHRHPPQEIHQSDEFVQIE